MVANAHFLEPESENMRSIWTEIVPSCIEHMNAEKHVQISCRASIPLSKK